MPYTLSRTTIGWWIIGDETGPMGPYARKGEAESDRRGLERFDKAEAKGTLWMTSDPQPQQTAQCP